MLESIRSGAQSFGVKVAFGIIILVFVFWGVGNFNDRDYSNVVAVVNGEPIVALQFEKAYHNAEEYLLRQNPGLTREQLAKEHLGRQVLRDLIQQTLLNQEAAKAGIAISPLQLRQAVGEINSFQDANGKFDPDAYKRVLEAQRISPAEYEQNIRNRLLGEKMFSLVASPAWVDPEEARNRFNFLRESRDIDYLFLPAANFTAKTQISENSIKEFYDNNQSDFAIPPKVNLAYILVKPADLANEGELSEERVKNWYEANKNRFEQKEQIEARHILAPVALDGDEASQREALAKIEKAAAELKAGKDFALVADQVNEKNAADKGGSLGWISRGQTVPEFEQAAFSLPVGQISEPVRSPFGWHLIQVTAKKEAGFAPYNEVAETAKQGLAAEIGAEKLRDALDLLIEDNILLKDFDQSAQRYGLKAMQSGLMDKEQLIAKLELKPEDAAALLALPSGSPVETALEAGDNYLIARVTEAKAPGTQPFEEVKDAIRTRLIAAEALEKAMQAAQTDLDKLQKEPSAEIRRQPGIKLNQRLERGGMLSGFQANDAIMQAIFSAAPQTWLPTPYALTEMPDKPGALIARVGKITPPQEEEFTGVAEILASAAKQQRMEGIFNQFLQSLLAKAKIEITNQNLIDRVNM